MIDRSAESGIRERVLAGESPELSRLAAQGLLPLPPEELVEMQVELAQGEDSEIAELAIAGLKDMDARVLTASLGDGTKPEVLRFLGLHLEHPTVLEAIIKRPAVSPDLLAEMAPRLAPALQ